MLEVEKRTKIFVLIFLIIVLLATWILTTSARSRIKSPIPPNNLEKAPIRIVEVTLAENQHDQLFEQFRNFADKHAFSIRIAPTDPTGDNFLVQMWREDIKVIGVESGDPGRFGIAFYNTYEERPVPLRVFDELIFDLEAVMNFRGHEQWF